MALGLKPWFREGRESSQSYSMEKILVIDHDRATQTALKQLFEAEGHVVKAYSDGEAGLAGFRASRPTLVILDLVLPRLPGREVFRQIKKESPLLPVLVLTAVADEAEKVLLLELGADGYVTKPFGSKELLARVRALVRRQHDPLTSPLLSFEDVAVDLLELRVTREGKPVRLTSRELRIVEYLIRSRARVVPRRELWQQVSGDRRGCLSTLRTHIANVRRKLEKDPKKPSHFVNVRGVGYKFVQ